VRERHGQILAQCAVPVQPRRTANNTACEESMGIVIVFCGLICSNLSDVEGNGTVFCSKYDFNFAP
jgi:hypothetical protein